eukprot:CFRG1561T1
MSRFLSLLEHENDNHDSNIGENTTNGMEQCSAQRTSSEFTRIDFTPAVTRPQSARKRTVHVLNEMFALSSAPESMPSNETTALANCGSQTRYFQSPVRIVDVDNAEALNMAKREILFRLENECVDVLGDWLEDSAILKVFWDLRLDTDAMLHQLGINVRFAFDIQLLDVLYCRKYKREKIPARRSMDRAVEYHNVKHLLSDIVHGGANVWEYFHGAEIAGATASGVGGDDVNTDRNINTNVGHGLESNNMGIKIADDVVDTLATAIHTSLSIKDDQVTNLPSRRDESEPTSSSICTSIQRVAPTSDCLLPTVGSKYKDLRSISQKESVEVALPMNGSLDRSSDSWWECFGEYPLHADARNYAAFDIVVIHSLLSFFLARVSDEDIERCASKSAHDLQLWRGLRACRTGSSSKRSDHRLPSIARW